jgi:ubiquinone/menaquinone biosynthesis C-methylase UbiE
MDAKFTGERFVPGSSPKRLEDEHVERYRFAAQFARDKTVLDIACGTGYGSFMLIQAGARRVDGVDVAPDAIQYAQAHYTAPNLCFAVGDIVSFAPDKHYDLITCFETIEHVADYRHALHNLYQVLDRGGTLVISSPNRPITSPYARTLGDKPSNRFHIQEFTVDELMNELRTQQFVVDRSQVFAQRPQPYFRNRYLRALYKRLFKPGERANASVRPLSRLAPRVIVMTARKPL